MWSGKGSLEAPLGERRRWGGLGGRGVYVVCILLYCCIVKKGLGLIIFIMVKNCVGFHSVERISGGGVEVNVFKITLSLQ